MENKNFIQELFYSGVKEKIVSKSGEIYTIESSKPLSEFNAKCHDTNKIIGKAQHITYGIKHNNITLAYIIIFSHPSVNGLKVLVSNNKFAVRSKLEHQIQNPTKSSFINLVKTFIDEPHPLIEESGQIKDYPLTLLEACQIALTDPDNKGLICVSSMISDCNYARLSAMRQLKKVWRLDWLFRDCEKFNERDLSSITSLTDYLAFTCGSTIAFSLAGCLHIPTGNIAQELAKIEEFARMLNEYKKLLLSVSEVHDLIIHPNDGKPLVEFKTGAEPLPKPALKALNHIQRMINSSSFLRSWTQVAIKGRDDLKAIIIPPEAIM